MDQPSLQSTEPKVLILDIETSPMVAYSWGPKWETNLIEVLEESQIICFSAKWFNGKQVTKAQCDYTGYKKGFLNDKELVIELHALFDEADVILGQNSNDFDIKTINVRFVKHGLTPPSPYKMIDTKLEAKKYWKLPSYSLDDMGKYLNLGRKMSHEGFDLWKLCMSGDKRAWNKMKKYNAQDVLLTEQVYLKLRPFMKSHPNFGVLVDKNNCPKCGSSKVQARGYAMNSTTMYQRAQCKACGGWFRFGKNLVKLENKRMNV